MRKIFFFLSLSLTTPFLFAQVKRSTASKSLQKNNPKSIAVELPSVTIGTQIWTTQNLSVDHYRNGDIIPQVTDAIKWASLTTGAWCWYDNDSTTYAAIYGRLYNWYAVHDPRGLAPKGWHIPTDGEWNKLVKYLDPEANTTCSDCSQSNIAGDAMKNTTGWEATSTRATNSSGFAGIPGGCSGGRNGLFYGIGGLGRWWSFTDNSNTNAWSRWLNRSSSFIFRDNSFKSFGFSVRCIKN